MSSGTVTQPPAAWKTGPEGSGTGGWGGGGAQTETHRRGTCVPPRVPLTSLRQEPGIGPLCPHKVTVSARFSAS